MKAKGMDTEGLRKRYGKVGGHGSVCKCQSAGREPGVIKLLALLASECLDPPLQ